jgi:hypothetical protein
MHNVTFADRLYIPSLVFHISKVGQVIRQPLLRLVVVSFTRDTASIGATTAFFPIYHLWIMCATQDLYNKATSPPALNFCSSLI